MKLTTQELPNAAMTSLAEGEGETSAEENADGHVDKTGEASEPPVSLADLLGYVVFTHFTIKRRNNNNSKSSCNSSCSGKLFY